MRIIEINRPGGPENLRAAERPTPVPQAGEVLIRVAAAGLNRADLLQRAGHYPPPRGAPDWPGLEVAGVVASTGPGVVEFAAGDRVCALLAGGGYAEFCAVPVEQTLPVPAALDLLAAAALPESCFTVWSNVFDLCRLAAGETLLVHGGSSGIGVIAIQLAAALGHAVYATAGTERKRAMCEQLGARRAVNYREESFEQVVMEATAQHGVDVILDMVGGDYIARDLHCIAPGGRIGVIAVPRGASATIDLAQVMRRRATLTGSTLRPRSVAFKGLIKQALLQHVWPLVASGRIKPIIDQTFALTQASDAHASMERGEHIGKIVLVCS